MNTKLQCQFLNKTEFNYFNCYKAKKNTRFSNKVKEIEKIFDGMFIYATKKETLAMQSKITKWLWLDLILDSAQFFKRAMIDLTKREARKAVADIKQSLKCTLTSFRVLKFSLGYIETPTDYLKTKDRWYQIIEKNITTKFKKVIAAELKKKNTHQKAFENACNKLISEAISETSERSLYMELVQTLSLNFPKEEEIQSFVTSQNVEVMARLMALSLKHKFLLSKQDQNFLPLVKEILHIRRPQLKLDLLSDLISTAAKEPKTYDTWSKIPFKCYQRQAVAYFEGLKITSDPQLLSQLLAVSKSRYFKDKICSTELIHTLSLLFRSEFKPKLKESLLRHLITSFAQKGPSEEPKKEHVENQLTTKELQILKKQLSGKEKMLSKKRKNLQENEAWISLHEHSEELNIKTQLSRKQQSSKMLEESIKNVAKIVEKLKNKINSQDPQNIPNIKEDKKDDGTHAYETATLQLRMLLNLPESLLSDVVKKIEKKNGYKGLFDDEITKDIFCKVFKLQDPTVVKTDKILNLRAPGALIQYYQRVKNEVLGAEGKRLLGNIQEVVEHTMKGTLWDLRHDEASNPHLKQVFSFSSELKEKWLKIPKSETAKNLNPNVRENCSEFEIIYAEDPSDILMIGTDTHSCVSLDARMFKVKGIFNYVRDGRTHTIMAKNTEGKTEFEAQIRLMWDDKNNSPVLFLDMVIEEDDLRIVMEQAALYRANELGLPLVVKQNQFLGKKKFSLYSGTVKAGASPVPYDYTDYNHNSEKPPYSLPKFYHVNKSF